MENSQFGNPTPNQFTEEVRSFYQRDFKDLCLTFFSDPMNGLLSFLQNPPAKAFLHAMILYGSVFVLYLVGSYILVGDMRDYMGLSDFLSFALTPVLVMLVVSALAFLAKLVASGANFRSELLTGALCGIPMGLVIPIALLFRVLGEGSDLLSFFRSPFGGGGLMTVIVLYLFLMMTNVFQQSLKSAGIKDVLAWYLSPVSVLLAFYVGFSVIQNLF